MGALGRRCLICQPSSRTGENPPYGMLGGTVETSASFEARYAPLSYPTAGGDQRWSSLPRQVTLNEVGIPGLLPACRQSTQNPVFRIMLFPDLNEWMIWAG
jgi:hypothetical protein